MDKLQVGVYKFMNSPADWFFYSLVTNVELCGFLDCLWSGTTRENCSVAKSVMCKYGVDQIHPCLLTSMELTLV